MDGAKYKNGNIKGFCIAMFLLPILTMRAQ